MVCRVHSGPELLCVDVTAHLHYGRLQKQELTLHVYSAARLRHCLYGKLLVGDMETMLRSSLPVRPLSPPRQDNKEHCKGRQEVGARWQEPLRGSLLTWYRFSKIGRCSSSDLPRFYLHAYANQRCMP